MTEYPLRGRRCPRVRLLLDPAERRSARLVDWPRPTYLASRARRRGRQLARLARWIVDGGAFAAPPIAPALPTDVQWELELNLRQVGADPRLEAGKIRNVALAAAAFDGRSFAPGVVLSFWRTLGAPTAAAGFALGAEVRGGCVVPTRGGGLCVVANALFAAAVELGWRIHERAGHTLTTDLLAVGADATVAWPDVDLRVESIDKAVLACAVSGDIFRMRVLGNRARPGAQWELEHEVVSEPTPTVRVTDLYRRGPGGVREYLGRDQKRLAAAPASHRNCFTCDEISCQGRPRRLEGL